MEEGSAQLRVNSWNVKGGVMPPWLLPATSMTALVNLSLSVAEKVCHRECRRESAEVSIDAAWEVPSDCRQRRTPHRNPLELR
jgi:hypothetical protein